MLRRCFRDAILTSQKIAAYGRKIGFTFSPQKITKRGAKLILGSLNDFASGLQRRMRRMILCWEEEKEGREE